MRADTTGFRTDTIQRLLGRKARSFAEGCARNADACRRRDDTCHPDTLTRTGSSAAAARPAAELGSQAFRRPQRPPHWMAGPNPQHHVASVVNLGSTRRSAGNRKLKTREPPGPGRGSRGTHLLRGGSLPRPAGGSPPGAALPPVGSPGTRGQPVPAPTRPR